jgi:hypothetical protein
MEGNSKKLVYAIGMQILLLAIALLTIYAIVWAASKGWKAGQSSKMATTKSSTDKESKYCGACGGM